MSEAETVMTAFPASEDLSSTKFSPCCTFWILTVFPFGKLTPDFEALTVTEAFSLR